MAQRIWQGAKCLIPWEKLLYWGVSKISLQDLHGFWRCPSPRSRGRNQPPSQYYSCCYAFPNLFILAATFAFNLDLLLCLEHSPSHCLFLHCFPKHHEAVSSVPKKDTKRLSHQSLGSCHFPAQLPFKNWNHLSLFQNFVQTKCTHTDQLA